MEPTPYNTHQFATPPNQTSDFENKAPNLLATSKDLKVKKLFHITNSEVSSVGGQKFGRKQVSGSVYTTSAEDYLLAVVSFGVAPNIGLSYPPQAGIGKTFIVKDEVGEANTTNITIRSVGERTIEGASSTTISTNFGSKSFYTDGSNWFTY